MFSICICPRCKNPFVVKISIDCLEKLTFETEDEAKKYILENVVIKTATMDDVLLKNIRTTLKNTLQNEELYNRVINNLQSVFEARI